MYVREQSSSKIFSKEHSSLQKVNIMRGISDDILGLYILLSRLPDRIYSSTKCDY